MSHFMHAHKGNATANTCLNNKLYLALEQNMEHAILVDVSDEYRSSQTPTFL